VGDQRRCQLLDALAFGVLNGIKVAGVREMLEIYLRLLERVSFKPAAPLAPSLALSLLARGLDHEGRFASALDGTLAEDWV
jgi:hypothetical protein